MKWRQHLREKGMLLGILALGLGGLTLAVIDSLHPTAVLPSMVIRPLRNSSGEELVVVWEK